MRFEHLVEVNDPSAREAHALTREQVWRGLVLKAEDPLLFIEALDDCRITSRAGTSIRRELRFGNVIVRDTVAFLPPDRLCQTVEASAQVPGATLVTRIETHGDGRLRVRFAYETTTAPNAAPPDAMVEELVRQAYVEADNDAIRTVRRLAAEGGL